MKELTIDVAVHHRLRLPLAVRGRLTGARLARLARRALGPRGRLEVVAAWAREKGRPTGLLFEA
ncbi:MAG: hypothetical protein N2378_16190 [Chloroflexaceae bacterium]|nr:hypothetical protein [Chloroflexaceae bacterium]